ncbi:hypothetical protein ACFC26_27445 [Kitasatospora purpeofusca]|uniref:hypothetical protein n=1 Tax=Kitasatospora purpeofusca TaxID=67352 RepID=UPI0035D6A89E
MTIGLTHDTGRLARVAVGLLAMAVSVVTIHSVWRHRRHELADSIWLADFEVRKGWPRWANVHNAASVRADDLGVKRTWLPRVRTFQMWISMMTLFCLIGLGIMISGIVST